MSDVKCAFVVQRAQYKGETSRLAITHGISFQVVEMLLEDGETLTPAMCFIGEGVLGLTKGQDAMGAYGITSTESHMMNACLVDLECFMCKEDMDKYGITADQLPDAEEMGADIKIEIVPMSEISKKIDEARHVLVF